MLEVLCGLLVFPALLIVDGVPDVQPVGYLRQLRSDVPVGEPQVVAGPDLDELLVRHRDPPLYDGPGGVVPLVLRRVHVHGLDDRGHQPQGGDQRVIPRCDPEDAMEICRSRGR